METLQMTHTHGGNGFAVVHDLGDNYYRVTQVSKTGIGAQFFLAYGGMLKPDMRENPYTKEMEHIPIAGDALEKVKAFRKLLLDGDAVIENTRLVKSKRG